MIHKFPISIKGIAKKVTIIAAAALALLAALFPAACNQVKPVARANSTGILDQVIQNKSISVSLCGLMTFDDHGQNVTSFKEFGVQDIPITWADTTFKGNTTSTPGPNRQITDNVHGVVTHDGRFLEHVSFWRIIKEDGEPDTVIDITVYAIPMDGTGSGKSTLATAYEQTGDIRKHVLDITWETEGEGYVCTDWANKEQPPALKVQFSK